MKSILITAALGMLLLAGESLAQAFPNKTIKLVATSSPGSPVDLFSRAIADYLAQSTGQTVLVENRAGAGGTLAAGYVLGAEADGHVALVNTSAQVIAPFTYTNLAFDMRREFTGVAPLAVLPNVLIVPPQRPWKNLKELIAAAQAKPGALNYGTGGSGTGTHMSAERFRISAGINAVQVPYKGSPEALIEVISGRIDWSILPMSTVLAHVKDGRVRAIALSAERRSAQLPDLPTIAESGLADADFPFWVGMFVSSKVPRSAVRRLHEITQKGIQTPEVRARYEKLGAEPFLMTLEDFDAFVRAQAEVAGAIIKAANIRAN
ncbi:MAG TPA: tripartite tricarboxylate transporter substrate binding protein [Burkholderiales bacterium]|nr:tripartite tricarboxylate transporter substrate binding protein [Burkholderiales bacterium]